MSKKLEWKETTYSKTDSWNGPWFKAWKIDLGSLQTLSIYIDKLESGKDSWMISGVLFASKDYPLDVDVNDLESAKNAAILFLRNILESRVSQFQNVLKNIDNHIVETMREKVVSESSKLLVITKEDESE